jgi:hypothetical protein
VDSDAESYCLDDFPLMELVLRRHFSNSVSCQNQDPEVQEVLSAITPSATEGTLTEWVDGSMDLSLEWNGGLDDGDMATTDAVAGKILEGEGSVNPEKYEHIRCVCFIQMPFPIPNDLV